MASEATGKVILIMGSTDGIGRQTALDLARMGARVLLHGRNQQRGQETLETIRRETGNDQLELYLADLSSRRQVRELANQIVGTHDRLDVVVNNAGVFEPARRLTEDGVEMTFAVNYLAVFLLTQQILDLLKASAPSRIVNVSSGVHGTANLDWDNLQGEKVYDGYQAYALSKLSDVIFTLELAERLRNTGVTANCL
ncbi:MAG TPA: SDR family NAD(P)-dependent oxidoreductase, partial [Chloroflexota bacterium]|nr:SDR family NAD(P)-dependent oxidoreductase [Chloroflexota bacterium]